MKDFFKAIESLFVDVLFAPLDWFRFMDNWWASNTVNWIFTIIGFVAMVYWINKLKLFNDNNEEDKSITAHTYL
ncbi:uracil phosphoribosyltransferase [Leptobacterium flavescens]|uniref:Uracil phosphoribosyltransferase n=1 Tax=Leptobacterium flavescens TaxID=472055 RepID=A0A6P0US85_9FLAO|nr:uracil phosphoribosyltransferase [Leptobacterium flavescens]NER13236.1 uracil phosphoribosyltransferase [Leptobacterium flavescens]